jgi:hypothetical protein
MRKQLRQCGEKEGMAREKRRHDVEHRVTEAADVQDVFRASNIGYAFCGSGLTHFGVA